MAQAGAAIVLSRLLPIRCGFSRSLAASDLMKTMRAGEQLALVGPIFIKIDDRAELVVAYLAILPGIMRARFAEKLIQRRVVDRLGHSLPRDDCCARRAHVPRASWPQPYITGRTD